MLGLATRPFGAESTDDYVAADASDEPHTLSWTRMLVSSMPSMVAMGAEDRSAGEPGPQSDRGGRDPFSFAQGNEQSNEGHVRHFARLSSELETRFLPVAALA